MIRKVILNSLYYSGAQAALGPLTRGMGAIFMLHHVRDEDKKPFSPNHHLSASPGFLNTVISQLKHKGFQFVSMDAAADRLENPASFTGEPPFLTMTLDDGYRDNLKNAVPVFRKHNVPYTVYVAPGMIEGQATLWWEDLERVIAERDTIFVDLPRGRAEFDLSTTGKKKTAFCELLKYLIHEVDEEVQRRIVSDLAVYYDVDPKGHLSDQVMDWAEVHELSRDPLCSLGAHTINHFALSKLDDEKALFEMRQSAEILKVETGKRPAHFAYPYGFPEVASTREFDLASRCGFRTAVTTRHGMIYHEHANHMMALPRVSINGHHQSMHYIDTLLSGIPGRLRNFGAKLDVA